MQSALSGQGRKWPPPHCLKHNAARAFLLWLLLAAAAPLCAQSITLSVNEVPFENALRQLGAQSGHQLVYTHETIQKGRAVSLTLKKVPLRKALDRLFEDQPLTYQLDEDYIIVKAREEKVLTPATRDVSGTVTDEQGTPLVGVTVSISGTARATATDAAGAFTLPEADPTGTLIFSSIGYKTLAVPLNGRTVVHVQLAMVVNTLDETVVIAYGTTTRRLATGSISKVSGSQIEKQPVTNPLTALQGFMPGVYVAQTSGLPGANVTLRIRGQNSIGAGNDPLYIVDGVPFTSTPLNGNLVNFNGANGQVSPFNSLNPADIESVEVLKDADATAIYGSRGANGVVLITTRKGKSDKTTATLNVFTGISRVSQLLDYLNTDQYLQLRREAFLLDGTAPTVSTAPDLLVWDTTRYTNWSKYLMGGTARVTDVQAGISGGNSTTHFLFSGNFHREGSVLPGDFGYRRAGSHVQVGHQSADKKFSTTISVNYSADNNKLIKSSLITFITLPPNFPLYDAAGNYNWTGGDNPAAYLKRTSKSQTENMIANTTLRYRLLPGLHLKTNLGYTSLRMSQVLTQPLLSQKPSSTVKNSAFFGNSRSTTYLVEPLAEWDLERKKSRINLLAGSTWQQTVSDGTFLQGDNYANESFLESLAAAGTISSRIEQYTNYKYASFFSRLNYSWKETWLLNGSFRRDGSSRFGPGREWGNFGALGAGWIFSRGPAFKKALPFVSFAKLRASYGLTGNDQISDYQYLRTYSTGSLYGGSGTLGPSRIENPVYSWETNRKLETALELGFCKDRYTLTAAWFRNRSSNLLVLYPLPSQSGFTFYQANLPGLVQNTGLELSANAHILNSGPWQAHTAFNITFPHNRLVDYPDLASSVYASTYIIGEDLSIKKGYHFLGVDPATGIAQFADINKDGKLTNPGDFVPIGKTSPDYYGGFQNSVSWKGVELDFFFQFVKQLGQAYTPAAGAMSNNLGFALQRWQQPGDRTSVPRPSATPSQEAYQNNIKLILSDRVFQTASFLRFKTLSLAYRLPARPLQKLKWEQCRFYLLGQNLLTLTKYRQLDPETQGGNVPPLKTLTAGFQITF